jgi:CBS domain containing-hemolysin-like protein
MTSAALINLLIAILLLAANAFYVAAEFALVKSRGFRINAMAEEGRFGARLLQRMVENIEAYLACCQLGITMASLGLGWVGEPTVSALLEPLLLPLGMPESALHFTSFMTGFLVFSSLHIVIGEQVPKTRAILRMLGVSESSQSEILTDVEIEQLVEESAEHGSGRPHEGRISSASRNLQ